MNRHWLLMPLVAALAIGIGYFVTFWATPTVIMDRAWNRLSERAGVNHMAHTPQVDATRREIVRPSPDLAYSVCAFDVAKAPLKIHVAPIPGHYWSLTVFDQDTNAIFVRSDRDTGGKPVDIVLAMRNQATPEDLERLAVKSHQGVALVRILLKGREDFAAVEELRAASYCQSLGS